MAEFFDVVIAGGGPAGSTAGTGGPLAIVALSYAGVSAKAIRDDCPPE
jgi:hypothetical protein